MSEKRFTLGYEDDFFRWIRDNPNRKNYVVKIGFGEEDNLQDVCDLLNQLNNENEQLKNNIGEQGVRLDFAICETQDFKNKWLKLKKENEQLKETNQELYDFRLVLNALLFNEWAETGKYEVYKSKRHHDGELCFDGEWFVVVAILPTGQITNHYHIDYWDYFKIPSYDKVKDEFDGHTSSVVLLRYGVLLE